MSSYLEASARERIAAILDAGSFTEFLPPTDRVTSPHLAQLDAPLAFDDGVAVGRGSLHGESIFVAAQEGAFMGGAVGEVHGAKVVGMLRRAILERAYAVVLMLETGGVRLHEANAGLLAVSEIMRAVLDTRAAGIPVVVLIGGSNGCFGGMGIVARCADAIVMSEEGRLAMSGPEVIETASGVEDFDSQDRALIWRTTGGKHRYLLGDCDCIVADRMAAFREEAWNILLRVHQVPIGRSLVDLEAEHQFLAQRLQRFGDAEDPLEIWQCLGVMQPQDIATAEAADFVEMAREFRLQVLS